VWSGHLDCLKVSWLYFASHGLGTGERSFHPAFSAQSAIVCIEWNNLGNGLNFNTDREIRTWTAQQAQFGTAV
jgi:hypothetical protein